MKHKRVSVFFEGVASNFKTKNEHQRKIILRLYRFVSAPYNSARFQFSFLFF